MTDLNATWNEQLRGPRMSETTGRVIFKYQMPVLEEFTMDLPKGAEIIRMQDMDGMFWLWAVVNTEAPMEKRYFRAFKTGAKIPDNVELKYVGFCAVFVQMELGLYIFEDMTATKEAYNKAEDERIERLFTLSAEGGDRLWAAMTDWMYVAPHDMSGSMTPVEDVPMAKTNPADLVGMPTLGDLLAQALANLRKKEFLNQNRIDAIEAQGGFDEEDDA